MNQPAPKKTIHTLSNMAFNLLSPIQFHQLIHKLNKRSFFTATLNFIYSHLLARIPRFFIEKINRQNQKVICYYQSWTKGQAFPLFVAENIISKCGLLQKLEKETFLKQYNSWNIKGKIISHLTCIRSKCVRTGQLIIGQRWIGLAIFYRIDLRIRKLLNQQQKPMPTQTVGKKEQAWYSTLGNIAIFPYSGATKLFAYSSVSGVAVIQEFLMALSEGFLETLAFFLIFLASTLAVDKFIPTILAALLMLLLFSKSSQASFFFYYNNFRNTYSVTLWQDRFRLGYNRQSMEVSADIRYSFLLIIIIEML